LSFTLRFLPEDEELLPAELRLALPEAAERLAWLRCAVVLSAELRVVCVL
jgi:hypothetical protein